MKAQYKNPSNKFFAVVYLVLILCILMISSKSNAQSVTGCTDPDAINYNPYTNVDIGGCYYEEISTINSGGWSTSALVGVTSNTLDPNVDNQIVMRIKEVNSSWYKYKINLPHLTYNNSFQLDTLGISYWYYKSLFINVNGDIVSDGGRTRVYLRFNNLSVWSDYKVRANFKQGGVNTNKLVTFFSTQGFTEAPTNPAPQQPQPRLANTSNNNEVFLLDTFNAGGQSVNINYKGIVIELYSDGTTKKIYR